MEFLDPKKRKQHRIRLFIGYGLMAIALTIAATVLFFEARGFDVDRSTGELIQNGIVLVDAHPEPAEIFLDGQAKGTTGARFVIPSGRHSVTLSRAGYNNWQRDFNLEGGSIERLVYPFLIPADINRADETLLAEQPAMVSQSLDRRWLIMQSADKPSTMQLVDLSQEPTKTSRLALNPALFSGDAESYDVAPIEWADDNRHLIIKHTFDGGSEFIRIDREEPARSVNLTKTIPAPFTSLSLFNKAFDTYYLYNAANKQLVTIKDGETESKVIAGNVVAYKSHARNELVIIALAVNKPEEVLVSVVDEDGTYPLRSLPVSKAGYITDIARYDDDWIIITGSKQDGKAFVYQGDIFGTLRSEEPLMPQIVLQPDNLIAHGEFSANSRFFVTNDGGRIAVYDAEKERQYRFNTDLAVPVNGKAYWMDGHRLTIVANNELDMIDYDGINQQTLAPVAKNYGKAIFDRDYYRLFTIGESQLVDGRYSLLKSYLRTEADR